MTGAVHPAARSASMAPGDTSALGSQPGGAAMRSVATEVGDFIFVVVCSEEPRENGASVSSQPRNDEGVRT